MAEHIGESCGLRAESLCAGYGGMQRLTDLSVSFETGRITGVIGPNGSGKSTLLRALSGQLLPMAGQIFLGGARLDALKPRQRARLISYLPQSRALPEMTVRRMAEQGRYPHLRFGQGLSVQDQEIVEEALRVAQVDALAERMVNTLSGGEMQRACLAMALAQDTPWLLMDEPAAHMDLSHQFELMALLRTLAARGKGVVIVLHELALALTCCDRLLLLEEGQGVLQAPPSEMVTSGLLEKVFGVTVERTAAGNYAFGPATACMRGK